MNKQRSKKQALIKNDDSDKSDIDSIINITVSYESQKSNIDSDSDFNRDNIKSDGKSKKLKKINTKDMKLIKGTKDTKNPKDTKFIGNKRKKDVKETVLKKSNNGGNVKKNIKNRKNIDDKT